MADVRKVENKSRQCQIPWGGLSEDKLFMEKGDMKYKLMLKDWQTSSRKQKKAYNYYDAVACKKDNNHINREKAIEPYFVHLTIE